MKIHAQTVASLLRQADIKGYIALGAPADEYDTEAEALARAFAELEDKDATVESIAAIVTEAWKQSFNLPEADLGKREPDNRALPRRSCGQSLKIPRACAKSWPASRHNKARYTGRPV